MKNTHLLQLFFVHYGTLYEEAGGKKTFDGQFDRTTHLRSHIQLFWLMPSKVQDCNAGIRTA